MCGRFSSTASPEELMRLFGVTVLENLQPRWNVAPSQSALVIRQSGLQAEAVSACWGFAARSARAQSADQCPDGNCYRKADFS
jgi:putative SOS response-associated peptidase YedK